MSTLNGRVAIVTGAASGLGAAVAELLGDAGVRLVLVDRDERVADTAAALSSRTTCLYVRGDVSIRATHDQAASRARDAFGRVDVLCNVAGISPPMPVRETTEAFFDTVMHTNCLGQLLAIQSVVDDMARGGGGSIINVASVGALVALPRLTAYCASKAAVLGLTRGIAYEFAEHGIRCNAICPGGIDTPMASAVLDSFDDRDGALARLTGRQLMKRFAAPHEIGSLVLYLASPESSFVTGAVLAIEAGHTAW